MNILYFELHLITFIEFLRAKDIVLDHAIKTIIRANCTFSGGKKF